MPSKQRRTHDLTSLASCARLIAQQHKELERLYAENDLLLTVLGASMNVLGSSDGALLGAMDQLAEAVDDYDAIFGPHDPAPCADCGVDTTPWADGEPTGPWEYYMVRNELWEQATASTPARFLCIGCLEFRIGRELTYYDFINAPINDPTDDISSDRLRQRLWAGHEKP